MSRQEADDLSATAIAYRLTRSPNRRRTMEISISRAGVVSVAVPERTPAAEVEAFVRARRRWIGRQLQELHSGAARPRRSFADGESVPYLGEQLPLRVVEAEGAARVSVRLAGGRLHVRVPARLQGDGARDAARDAIERWYRLRARAAFAERIRVFAPLVGARPRKLVVRGQKTRWGSCGKDGTLRLNWHLMMAPPALVDYIVVHELCHLRRLGHGKAFWRLVAKVLPDYAARRAQLRREGAGYRID